MGVKLEIVPVFLAQNFVVLWLAARFSDHAIAGIFCGFTRRLHIDAVRLAGMIELSGVEGQLRVGMMSGYGFIGFLASWLVRHDPLKTIGSAVLLGAIAVGGNGLKLSAGLSGASVNILMAVMLLAILGWSQKQKATR